MGGHKAGEVASSSAIESFCDYAAKNAVSVEDDKSLEEFLGDGVRATNTKLLAQQKENPEWHGMGTTFSLCVVKDDRFHYAHVGDSRIYTAKKDDLTRITKDHTLVGEMLRLGRITEEEANAHPNKNILIRVIGEAGVEVDTGTVPLEEGVRILICSDGLSDMVSDADIMEIMSNSSNTDEQADELVALARLNGRYLKN
jgi:protein phosphatase